MFWMLTAWAHWAPPPSDSLKLMFPSWYCPHFHQQEIKTGVTLRSAVGTHRYVPGLVSSLTPSITLSPSSVMPFCFLSSVLSPSSSHCFSPHFFLVLLMSVSSSFARNTYSTCLQHLYNCLNISYIVFLVKARANISQTITFCDNNDLITPSSCAKSCMLVLTSCLLCIYLSLGAGVCADTHQSAAGLQDNWCSQVVHVHMFWFGLTVLWKRKTDSLPEPDMSFYSLFHPKAENTFAIRGKQQQLQTVCLIRD